jgi:hypothetical protein
MFGAQMNRNFFLKESKKFFNLKMKQTLAFSKVFYDNVLHDAKAVKREKVFRDKGFDCTYPEISILKI